MAVRKPDTIDCAHAKMVNPVVIKTYFDTLEKVRNEKNLMEKPDKNNKNGLDLELRKGKFVISRSSKHAYSQVKGGRDYLTINCCVSPAGYMLPPLIIYEKLYPSGNYVKNSPIGALYGKSPNGYMEEELFWE